MLLIERIKDAVNYSKSAFFYDSTAHRGFNWNLFNELYHYKTIVNYDDLMFTINSLIVKLKPL